MYVEVNVDFGVLRLQISFHRVCDVNLEPEKPPVDQVLSV